MLWRKKNLSEAVAALTTELAGPLGARMWRRLSFFLRTSHTQKQLRHVPKKHVVLRGRWHGLQACDCCDYCKFGKSCARLAVFISDTILVMFNSLSLG